MTEEVQVQTFPNDELARRMLVDVTRTLTLEGGDNSFTDDLLQRIAAVPYRGDVRAYFRAIVALQKTGLRRRRKRTSILSTGGSTK
jgi:hypothetical protein